VRLQSIQPVTGYRRAEKEGRVVLVIESREGKIVRLIYHWYVYGDERARPLSFYKISEKLTAMGIPSPGMARGNYRKKSAPEHWRSSAVQYIVRSETYAGQWYFSRYQWSSKKRNLRPRAEWIPVKISAIIDRELWNAAQKRANENHHRTRSDTKHQYLMQARLQCANCGSAYTGSTSVFRGGKDVYSYYKCNGWNKQNSNHWHDKRCNARQVRADVVDARVWEWLQTIFEHPDKVLAGLRVKQAEQQQTHRLLSDRIEIIDTELVGCRKKLANMIDLCTNTAVSDETKAVFEEKEAQIRVHPKTPSDRR
jgi:site-specific DNA recombinase